MLTAARHNSSLLPLQLQPHSAHSSNQLLQTCTSNHSLLVSAHLNHCVAFNPSTVTSLIHLFIHPVSRTHVRVSRSPTTFSLCPTLSRSHTHTDSCPLSHWLLHSRYLAFTHLRTLSRLIALSPGHCTTLPCPHIILSHVHIRSFCRDRSTLPHPPTLPLVWLSHWFSITLYSPRHALLSHAPPSHYPLSRSHCHTFCLSHTRPRP